MWAVYCKQIRKSEQGPPLHLRTADLVAQPRTPFCHTAIARCKLRQDKRTRARQQARNIEKGDREREKKANAKEALERVDYPIYLYVLSYLSMSEAIIHPSVHRSPPATRVRWRLEVALAGVVEQHPQFACTRERVLFIERYRRGHLQFQARGSR